MDAVLARAVRLARSRNYASAIQLLESEVLSYRESWLYAYVLGLCYLKSGDAGSSYSLLRRAADINDRSALPLAALAALHIRRGESAKAVSLYLRVKDREPNNPFAKQGLKILQKYGGEDAVTVLRDETRLARLYPPFPRPPVSLRAMLPFFIIAGAVAATAAVTVLYKQGYLQLPTRERAEREGLSVSALSAEEKSAPAGMEGSFRYVLTSKEILASYERGRTLFNERRDDAARVEMNRILESNAGTAVKNKARLLVSYMESPDWTNITDRFSFDEVEASPFLYRDCTIIWRGMAANLETGDTATVFNFLVGYDTKTALSGFVKVRFNYAVTINTEKPLEVLGRVLPLEAGDGQAGLAGRAPFELQGVAIHEIKQ